MALVGYLTGSDQERIGAFCVADEQAFRPVALEPKPAFGQYVPVSGGIAISEIEAARRCDRKRIGWVDRLRLKIAFSLCQTPLYVPQAACSKYLIDVTDDARYRPYMQQVRKSDCTRSYARCVNGLIRCI
jgi:hypothetical protein